MIRIFLNGCEVKQGEVILHYSPALGGTMMGFMMGHERGIISKITVRDEVVYQDGVTLGPFTLEIKGEPDKPKPKPKTEQEILAEYERQLP